jgi:O-antigen/teichoic acid export membrane protein
LSSPAPTRARPPVRAAGDTGHELRRLAHGGALNLGGAGVGAALGFAFTAVASRHLGASGAGAFFSLVALATIASTLLQFGAPAGLVRMLARAESLGRSGEIRPLLMVGLIPVAAASILGAAVLMGEARPFAGIVISGHLTATATRDLQVLAVWIVADVLLTTAVRACQGLGNLVPLVAVANIGVPTARLVLLLGAIAVGQTASLISLAWTLPAIAGAVIAVGWLRRIAARVSAGAASVSLRTVSRPFWSFTSYQGLSSGLQILLLWLDVLLVAALRSSQEAGVYNAASRYLAAGSLVLTSVVFVMGPLMSGLIAQRDYHRAGVVYQTATAWLVAISFPVYLLLAVFSPTFMALFGPSFAAGAAPLAVLALAMLLNVSTGAVKSALLMGGRSRAVFAVNVAALAANVGLNLLLIPRYGMMGAALAWSASIFLNNLIPVFQVRRAWGMQPVSSGSLIAAIAAVACFGVFGVALRTIEGSSPATLGLTAALGSLMYLAALWRWRSQLHVWALRDALRRRSGAPA